jgi:hypothetical protein
VRYIPIQPDIALTNIEGDPVNNEKGDQITISFKRFVLARLMNPQFTQTMDGVLVAVQIKQAVEAATDVIEIETEDWKRLVEATKSPHGGYNAQVAHCLAPFMKAITEASEKRPEKQLQSAAE